MASGFFSKNIADSRKCFFPGIEFYILKREKDHRVFSLIISIFLSAGPYFFVVEVDGCIPVALFKIGAQHIHIESLAKAARTGKQGYHWTLIDKIFDHHRLVDVVVFR